MISTFQLLDPHQTHFVNSKKRYVLNSGGVGSGKTYSIILKTLNLLINNPGVFILLGAKTYPALRDTVLREFLNVIPDEIVKSFNKSTLHFRLKNGSEVIFRSLEDENKLKSLNLGAVGIDEMTEVSEEVFKMLRTRLRQKWMPAVLYGATNPSTFGNWVYKYFIEHPIDDSEVIYSISADNKYLPAEYLKDLESLRKSNPEYYERMVMGRWGALEGLIYNLPLAQRNTPKRNYQRYIAGMDFGYDHPTAFLVCGIVHDFYHVIAEHYERKLTPEDISNIIQGYMKEYPIDIIYCDGARPEIIEQLNRHGIPAVGADKDVFDGIMTVKQEINNGKLFVNQTNCPYTLREIDSYAWDAKNKIKEVPIKLNDDCMDALRYMIYSDKRKNCGIIGEDFGDFGKRIFDNVQYLI